MQKTIYLTEDRGITPPAHKITNPATDRAIVIVSIFPLECSGPHLVAGQVYHLLLSMIDDRPRED